MSEALGYIVVNKEGRPLQADPDRILWLGDAATVFVDYETARNAVRKTARYAKRHGYSWGHGQRIMPLVPV